MSTGQSAGVELPKLIKPAPEAASITRYALYPVSFFTGLPQISIPIYNINVRNFNLPISLNYHASGIKVDDYASCVGLGWNLNAGGAITRSVMGVPDDDSYGLFYNPIKRENQYRDSDFNKLGDAVEGNLDTQPDLFYFNFLGQTGKFVFGPDKKIRLLPKSNLKINFNNGVFSVVDAEGNTYWFEMRGSTRTWSENSSARYFPYTSWYLTKIILNNKADTISLDYISSNPGRRESIDFHLPLGIVPSSSMPVSISRIAYPVQTTNYSEFEDIYLKSIKFPGGKVRFAMSYGVRKDAGFYTLDSIIVENDAVPVKKFALAHDHFFSDQGLNPYAYTTDKYRLKLTEVSELGGPNDNPVKHRLVYEEQAKLPPRKNCGIDWWGYSNGSVYNEHLMPLDITGKQYYVVDGVVTSIPKSELIGFDPDGNNISYSSISKPANRTPNADAMTAGMLKRIYYPTGGYTDFNYEPNRIQIVESKPKPGGSYFVAAKPDDPPNDPSRVTEFVADVTIPENDPAPAEMRLSIPVWSNETQPYAIFENLTKGTWLRYTTFPGEPVSRTFRVALQAGDRYRLTTSIAPDPTGSTPGELTVSMTLSWPGRGTILVPVVQNGAGLRIESISSYTADNKLAKSERFKYGENESGFGKIRFFDYLFNKWAYEQRYSYCIKYGTGETGMFVTTKKDIYSRPLYSYSDMGGNTISYPVVTKYETSANGDNGKTVYKYDFEFDDKIEGNYPEPQLLVSAEWKNGNLLSESIYKRVKDTTYKLIGENSNTYGLFLFDTIYGLKVRAKITPGNHSIKGCSTVNPDLLRINDFFNYFEYPVISGVKKVLSSTTKQFSDNGDSIVNVSTYSYGNPSHMLATAVESADSKGRTIKTIYRYPQDKAQIANIQQPESNAIDTLVSRNMVERLIEQEEYRDNLFVKRDHFEYGLWGALNELVALKKVNFKLGNSNTENRFEVFGYDKFGNILEQAGSNNIHEVYIWGYNNLYPVARIMNNNYSAVRALLNDNIIQNPASMQALHTELGKVRTHSSLSTSLMGIYTYLPLVGQTSIVSENGRITYYEYDSFGRLKLIKDQEGKILKQFDYQYSVDITK
ncbi:hypothetical protein ACTJJB_24265 [Chitinophaga sp. 22536]|uniref:hypothetical protein n=1 Tax=unclassified Chitinophaga TaxID=2619133 RepID=UPI003F8579F3